MYETAYKLRHLDTVMAKAFMDAYGISYERSIVKEDIKNHEIIKIMNQRIGACDRQGKR